MKADVFESLRILCVSWQNPCQMLEEALAILSQWNLFCVCVGSRAPDARLGFVYPHRFGVDLAQRRQESCVKL